MGAKAEPVIALFCNGTQVIMSAALTMGVRCDQLEFQRLC